jgi:hypothetical protein
MLNTEGIGNIVSVGGVEQIVSGFRTIGLLGGAYE